MDRTSTPEALEDVGMAFENLGRSLRRLAAAQRRDASRAVLDRARQGIPQDHEMRLLLGRLGSANQKFLFDAAAAFDPQDTFSLQELADVVDSTKASVRARLMNIGRSMKSLGGHAPELWDVSWDETERENSYQWDYDAHRALLRILEE